MIDHTDAGSAAESVPIGGFAGAIAMSCW